MKTQFNPETMRALLLSDRFLQFAVTLMKGKGDRLPKLRSKALEAMGVDPFGRDALLAIISGCVKAQAPAPEPELLETLFNDYVVGDWVMEGEYAELEARNNEGESR